MESLIGVLLYRTDAFQKQEWPGYVASGCTQAGLLQGTLVGVHHGCVAVPSPRFVVLRFVPRAPPAPALHSDPKSAGPLRAHCRCGAPSPCVTTLAHHSGARGVFPEPGTPSGPTCPSAPPPPTWRIFSQTALVIRATRDNETQAERRPRKPCVPQATCRLGARGCISAPSATWAQV